VSGRVLVSGSVATKPARMVDAGEPIELTGPPPRFVGRGGEKLDAALEHFDVAVDGLRCLDAGASTGGFTDCLLQRGAIEVIAVDVGYGQLHERLRRDERVRNIERTNIRSLTTDEIGGPVDVLVADLSFISLRVVLTTLVSLARPASDLVLLVKPQFEAGREEASRGRGVITDAGIWRRVLGEVRAAATSQGAAMMGAMPSPITGAEGNVEFLVHCRVGATASLDDAALDAAVAAVRKG
jgi:23S rRNA (cytidine1920-2'-O)/16S rRNA (cytidine1409-2'-O)-methyltransferase